MRISSIRKFAIVALATAAGLWALPAWAHTVQICCKNVGSNTTFYAGSYHSQFEGPSPIGGIIIDGVTYPFTGWILPSELPADVQCFTAPDDPPGVAHYQTFTGSFAAGTHSVSFTETSGVEDLWSGAFPVDLTFVVCGRRLRWHM